MKTKVFEVRDAATFIPVVCVEINSTDRVQEKYLVSRMGFSPERRYIQLVWVSASKTEYDPFRWNDRTMFNAHQWIRENWDSLHGGEVVDVEWILGEKKTVKASESEEE